MMALMYGGVSLGLVTVLLRFASRRISKTRFQADDWTIITAWVCEGLNDFSSFQSALKSDTDRSWQARQ